MPHADDGMTYRDRIRKAYLERFAECELELPTHWPNVAFEPPDPGGEDSFWARFAIQEADRTQVSTGQGVEAARRRVIGSMVIQFFVPLDRGQKDLQDLANSLIKAFTSVTYDGVVFRTPIANLVGRAGDWFQMNVVCPFYYDSFE